MGGLNAISWAVLIMGFGISFGGSIYCILIARGKDPSGFLERFGIMSFIRRIGDTAVEKGVYAPFEYMDRGPREKGMVAVIILILLTIGWLGGVFDSEEGGAVVPGGLRLELDEGAFDPITGYSNENTEHIESVDVEESAVAVIVFTLTWEDEEPDPLSDLLFENEPDEFQLNVTTPWGASEETPMTPNDRNTREGEISLEFEAPGDYPETGGRGEYVVIIRMGEAGDQESTLPFVPDEPDDGNEWTLTISYSYWKEVPPGIID